MSDEITRVDTDNTLWAAIVFLSALAYPESHASRNRAIAAMSALMYRADKKRGFIRRLPPDTLPVQQMENVCRLLGARLSKRLLAAEVCALLVSETRVIVGVRSVEPRLLQMARFHLLKRGWKGSTIQRAVRTSEDVLDKPWSLNRYARIVGPRFKADFWRPSVMHLGLGLYTAMHKHRIDPRPQPADPQAVMLRLLHRPAWVLHALAAAETNAQCWPITTNLPRALRGLKTCRHRVRLIPTA